MTKSDDPDFSGFYAATATRVIGYLCVVLGDMAEAEDAAHEAYARAWARWPKIREYDSPEAWVRTVALRVAMNSWRKAKNRLIAQRRSNHAEQRDSPDPAGLSRDRLVVIEALRKITVEQRQGGGPSRRSPTRRESRSGRSRRGSPGDAKLSRPFCRSLRTTRRTRLSRPRPLHLD